MTGLLRFCPIALVIIASTLVGSAAHAQRRVALIIGNSTYQYTPQLANPKNDAADMAVALKQLGFEVIEGRDLDKTAMDRLILRFAEILSGADLGTFFYAGHGLQVDGKNYLVPVDAKLLTAHALEFEMVRLDKVQRVMEGATQTNIIFLDACRDNPLSRNLARALGTRSTFIGRGLAQVEAGLGTLVSYATQPGAVALDGAGRNSPYTAALKERLLTPGQDLTSVLIDVRNDVLSATASRQVPWDQHALRAKLYLRGRPESGGILGGTDDARQARITQQIANAQSIQELDLLLRLEPSRAAEIAARKHVLMEKERSRDPIAALSPGSGLSARDSLNEGGECPFCPEMVVVPTGSFTMGSRPSEDRREPHEGPQRVVSIPQPFAAGRNEVTFAEWDACVADGGCKAVSDDRGWGRGANPVINVSWNDTQDFVRWLSHKSGRAYRLPSEAEWEYMARGGSDRVFWWGDAISDREANYNGTHTYGRGHTGEYRRRTMVAGTLGANAWGLYHVHGNVWEWVQDCWHHSYQGGPIDGSAWTTDCGENKRVLRGGSWINSPNYLRAASRIRYDVTYRHTSLGFRVARQISR